jgi:PAS domain S-box-containing protein
MLVGEENDTIEGLAAASEAFARSIGRHEGSLDWLPIGVCVCDRAGRITSYNRPAATLWGCEPAIGAEIYAIERGLKAADGRGAPLNPSACPIGLALRTGAPVRDAEIALERPDGAKIVLLASANPLFDERGQVVGAVKCFQDITEKKEAEQRLRRGARAIRELIDALPAAIYTTDAEGRLTFFNRSAVELWGREPRLNEDLWSGAHKLFTAAGEPMALDQCPMARALKEGAPIRNVQIIVERPDGARVPCQPFPTPFHDISGAPLGAINMLVDITERKEAEARQKVMLDELNHRVKNTLATVQAMAAQTFRAEDAPRADVMAFTARLMALAVTHDHLTRDKWEAADLGAMVQDVLGPLRGTAGGERIHVSGASVRLAPRTALTLGLTMNELATNAMKYGALSAPDGVLDVSWRMDEGKLVIEWRERGGPEVAPAPRRGFGTRMIERGIAGELDGRAELKFLPAGFECDLVIPAAALA